MEYKKYPNKENSSLAKEGVGRLNNIKFVGE